MRRYMLNLLIAVNQMVNAIFWGDPDETISSRVGKSGGWIPRRIAAFLNWIDPGHTTKVRESDRGKRG
jgi:hypothetical protein